MNNLYGCTPIYFSAAVVFLVAGGTLIYYDQFIIGAIVITPGLISLGLTFLTLTILSRLKRGDENVNIVVSDPNHLKQLQESQKLLISRKKSKKKRRKLKQKMR